MQIFPDASAYHAGFLDRGFASDVPDVGPVPDLLLAFRGQTGEIGFYGLRVDLLVRSGFEGHTLEGLVHDLLGRPVVGVQLDLHGFRDPECYTPVAIPSVLVQFVGEELGSSIEIQDVVDGNESESVDPLLPVPDDAEVGFLQHQEREHQLTRVGVLEFVYHHIAVRIDLADVVVGIQDRECKHGVYAECQPVLRYAPPEVVPIRIVDESEEFGTVVEGRFLQDGIRQLLDGFGIPLDIEIPRAHLVISG